VCPKSEGRERERIETTKMGEKRRKEEDNNFVVPIQRPNINGINSNLSMLFLRSRATS